MNSTNEPIVVEQTYESPAKDVWRAITNPDEMRKWFFPDIKHFAAEVGFETEFVVHCEGQDYPHQWTILEVVPEKRIVYRWRYGGYPGDSTVTWELFDQASGTRLVLTHAGHETFPRDNPIFSRESGVAGWTYFVRESLKTHLESR